MPVSNVYEVGKRSLLAYQSAINTTAGNISNVNNANYARRRVDLSQYIVGFSSLGLSLHESERMQQRYAQTQLWNENQSLFEVGTSGMLMGQVEDIFSEDTESGLSGVMAQFWDSWNDLANDPEGQYARALVKDKGVLLANTFQRIHTDLNQMQDQIRPQITIEIQEVNELTGQIAEINQKLMLQESPDLLDERDKLIDKLTGLIDVKVKETERGKINIYADGFLLVGDEFSYKISSETETVNGVERTDIFYLDSDKKMNITSGSLKALLDVHNNKIPEYLAKLDEMAINLAETVNNIHTTGENLGGITNISFFNSTITGASDFQVNLAVEQDPSLIATRLPGEAEGSNSIALSITDLRLQKTLNGRNVDEYYQSMIADIGNKIRETDFLENSQQNVIENLLNQKESITGVSLDEEMTRMVQFQQSYQAAAKIISTVSEMVDTVLALR